MAQDPPLDFGAQLAAARKQKNLSLEELSSRTKIRMSVLRAIERSALSELPGGLYSREFLRAFAREVGCDPEEIIRQYRSRLPDEPRGADAIAPADGGISVTCPSGQVSVAEIDAMTRRWRTAWIGSAVVLLGAAIYLGLVSNRVRVYQGQSTSPKPDKNAATVTPPSLPSVAPPPAFVGPMPPANVATVPPASGDQAPIATTGTELAAGASANADVGDLRLDVKPIAPCWLSAKADGKSVLYRLMDAGERAEIQAREEVVLTVGDPAGCGFDINGKAVRQLGSAGRPVTIRLTPKNFGEFLAP